MFGSVLRDDFRPGSDVDIVIEFPAGRTPSLLDLGGMQVELSAMLGRTVDLKTPGFMSPRVREHVMRAAQVRYVA
jgi:predicted nucleotidyltransferase